MTILSTGTPLTFTGVAVGDGVMLGVAVTVAVATGVVVEGQVGVPVGGAVVCVGRGVGVTMMVGLAVGSEGVEVATAVGVKVGWTAGTAQAVNKVKSIAYCVLRKNKLIRNTQYAPQ